MILVSYNLELIYRILDIISVSSGNILLIVIKLRNGFTLLRQSTTRQHTQAVKMFSKQPKLKSTESCFKKVLRVLDKKTFSYHHCSILA